MDITLRIDPDRGFLADRRAFMLGLGATAAAGLAPWSAASAAVPAAPAAALSVSASAVFWGLHYADASGAGERFTPPPAPRARVAHDPDPHAQLLGA